MNRFFALVVASILVCGCSGAKGPSVSLISLKFEDATALETTARFTLRISNEGTEPVQITGEVHKIYLNGLYIGKGLGSQSLEVPRLGTVTHDVTVHLSNLALATRIKSIIETKSIDYRIVSTFHGKSWLSGMSSENTGKLDLNELIPSLDSTNSPASTNQP